MGARGLSACVRAPVARRKRRRAFWAVRQEKKLSLHSSVRRRADLLRRLGRRTTSAMTSLADAATAALTAPDPGAPGAADALIQAVRGAGVDAAGSLVSCERGAVRESHPCPERERAPICEGPRRGEKRANTR